MHSIKLIVKSIVSAGRIVLKLDKNRSRDYWENRGQATGLREEQVDGFGCIVPMEELKPVLDWYVQHVVESVHKHSLSGRILDYGCGTGRYLKKLSESGTYDLFGVDYSQSMLDRHTRLQVPQGHLSCLSLVDGQGEEFVRQHTGQFNAIYSVSAIQYVPMSSIRSLLHAFQRLLAPEGLLILNFPHPSSLWESCSDLNYIRYWPRFLENLLVSEGLRIDQSMPTYGGERVDRVDSSGSPNHGYWIHAIKRA